MFARTQRLLLRPGWAEDAAALHNALNDQAIANKLANVPWPYTLGDAEAYLAKARAPHEPQFLIFSRTRGAPRLVGGCGIQSLDDGRHELGYWIARPFWGLGFATEATDAVMRAARSSGLKNIVARHATDNPASGRVLSKIGFRPTGRTETVYSKGRNAHVEAVTYEDSGIGPMRNDPSLELYMDRAQIAA